MTRQEWLEALVPLVVIILFWPMLFWGFKPAWYIWGVYAFSAVGLSWSLYHRITRFRRNLREAKDMMKTQQLGMPPIVPPGVPQSPTQMPPPEDADSNETEQAD